MLLDVMMPGMDGFEVLPRIEVAAGDARHAGDLPVGARRGGGQGVGPRARRDRLHHQADPGRRSARARRRSPVRASISNASCARAAIGSITELAGAAHMQRQLLPPTMPPHPSISFGSYYQTSRHAGGDYYDVLPLGGDRLGILVADVSGHGAPAAIVMAMIRAVVHTYPGVADDPPAVLHYINRHFQFLWDTPMYATAVYAVVDAARAHDPHVVGRTSAAAEGALRRRRHAGAGRHDDVPVVERADRRAVRGIPAHARRSMDVLHRRHHRSAGAGRHDVRPGAPRCPRWRSTVQRLPPPSSMPSSASSMRSPAGWSPKTIRPCWWWDTTKVLGPWGKQGAGPRSKCQYAESAGTLRPVFLRPPSESSPAWRLRSMARRSYLASSAGRRWR